MQSSEIAELYHLADEMRIALGGLSSLYPVDPNDQSICERWDNLVAELRMEERYGISHNGTELGE